MPYYISQQPLNPITRIMAALLAVVAFAGAFFFGLIIIAVVLGLGLLLWIGIRLRIWWAMRNQPNTVNRTAKTTPRDGVIETEYTVVEKKQDP